MLLPQSKWGGEIPPGTLAARVCVSAVRLAGLARWRLPVGVFSPICPCTGVSSGGGALCASPFSSVAGLGFWRQVGKGGGTGENAALGRASRRAWEPSTGPDGRAGGGSWGRRPEPWAGGWHQLWILRALACPGRDDATVTFPAPLSPSASSPLLPLPPLVYPSWLLLHPNTAALPLNSGAC